MLLGFVQDCHPCAGIWVLPHLKTGYPWQASQRKKSHIIPTLMALIVVDHALIILSLSRELAT